MLEMRGPIQYGMILWLNWYKNNLKVCTLSLCNPITNKEIGYESPVH